ncbi:MAG: hypothetical protein QF915_04670, partial [Candidatus Woesearchaeota archaeon]|nr:hypothetical protein [Candidatus Woesearchaeota archaeon]MDP7458064.1 hypothetical protein [Candidatus Woesearchaeota archaeon]
SHSSPHILLETPSSVTGGRFYVLDGTLFIEQGDRQVLPKSRIRLIDGGSIAIENANGNIFLTESGKIGINTIDPSVELEVLGTTMTDRLRLADTGGNNSVFWDIEETTENDLTFKYMDEKLRLTSRGKLGIGTNTPDEMLTVQGNVNIGGTTNGNLIVRHIKGKATESTDLDDLYLQHGTGNRVVIGKPDVSSDLKVHGDAHITQDLTVDGNITVIGNVSSSSGELGGRIFGFYPVNLSNTLVFFADGFESSKIHIFPKKYNTDVYKFSARMKEGKFQTRIEYSSVCGDSDSGWKDGVIETHEGRCMGTEGRTAQCHKGYVCKTTVEVSVKDGMKGLLFIHPRISGGILLGLSI